MPEVDSSRPCSPPRPALGADTIHHTLCFTPVHPQVRLSAPQYINSLFDWIEEQVDNPRVFPQQLGCQFPPDFLEVTKTIFKRLFRVYAHIYHSHCKQVCSW